MVSTRERAAWIGALALALFGSGCATVPQNRRAHLADPMMSISDEPTEAYRKQKLYTTREGAAGGDGVAAGGGCGCQ
jgi:starvation-inducible outer membrane lipoprotein